MGFPGPSAPPLRGLSRSPCQTWTRLAKTLRGNLDTFSLADLLQWLEINALSGRVIVTRDEVTRTIDLKGGAIVFVSSSRPEERLGAFLTARSLLQEQAVYELLAESFVTGRNLTRLILERKLLTREALGEAVESLAIQILLDLFHWSGATFEFDPLYRIEDLIRIHLSLRGQVLAFHGAKSLDDSGEIKPPKASSAKADMLAWEQEFSPEVLAESFWSILDTLPGDRFTPAELRGHFLSFHQFAERVRKRLLEPVRLFPLYDDTGAMLRQALQEGAGPERIVQIAALDPFLTADVLYLANALRTEPARLVGTVREAAEVVGAPAMTRLVGLLADPGTPKLPSAEKMEQVVRRAALSTAVAASHLSQAWDMSTDLAYTLGLLELLGSYDLLKLLMRVSFQPGPVRAPTLNRFRTVFGRALARKLNLPRMHEEVLGSTGRVTAKSPASEQLIFFAKQLAPTEQIGSEWMSEDPELADRYASLPLKPGLPQLVERDAAMLRDILQL